MTNNKKGFIGRIIVKEKTKGKQKFQVYSCVTENGNWFDVTFANDVVKPIKNEVIKVSADNWFTTYKKDKDEKVVLDKNGNKVKKLVILAIDEILDREDYPQCFKSYDLDTEI